MLYRRKRLQSHLIDRRDAELAKYHAQPFVEQEHKSTRTYEKELRTAAEKNTLFHFRVVHARMSSVVTR